MPDFLDTAVCVAARVLARRSTHRLMVVLTVAFACVFSLGNSHASSFCAYNKTRQQSVLVGSDKNSLTLSAGNHFCCKPNDALCGAASTTSSTPTGNAAEGRGVLWRIEANIGGRLAWCGDPTRRSSGIALTRVDSYLLIRDFRDTAIPPRVGTFPAPPVLPNPALAPTSPPAALRAPLAVDIMAADGKVLSTVTCQFTG